MFFVCRKATWITIFTECFKSVMLYWVPAKTKVVTILFKQTKNTTIMVLLSVLLCNFVLWVNNLCLIYWFLVSSSKAFCVHVHYLDNCISHVPPQPPLMACYRKISVQMEIKNMTVTGIESKSGLERNQPQPSFFILYHSV